MFLAKLAVSANILRSCQAAGVGRSTAYEHREADPAFAAAWDEAIENACDLLEETARERAQDGSDLLLIFLLKAHRPGLYRETLRHQIGADPNAPRLPLFVEVPVDDRSPLDRTNPA